jgi:hypothetical protein
MVLAWLAVTGVGYAMTLFSDLQGAANPPVDALLPAYGLMLAGVVVALVLGEKRGAKVSGEGGVTNGG